MSNAMYSCEHNMDGSILVVYATGRGCPLCSLEAETGTRSTHTDSLLSNRKVREGFENHVPRKLCKKMGISKKYL